MILLSLSTKLRLNINELYISLLSVRHLQSLISHYSDIVVEDFESGIS